ncbi:hypothetical protein [Alkalibacter rhizosphaerae]|uniref:hypothetical protein n=1 Tax=Alkalibacter rhizosphaerae TaxID=2815577 RepID=UPI001FF00DAD|nr:hypothetical protein [Alkalibacter rhizosphaerae]
MKHVYTGKTKDVYKKEDGNYSLRFKDDVTGDISTHFVDADIDERSITAYNYVEPLRLEEIMLRSVSL